MADASCAESVITNVSGGSLVLSMFGGQTLADAGTLTIKGDVWSWLAGKYPGIKGRRMIEKLHSLIENDKLEITSIPTAPCPSS
ncbi:MAG: hypothetical protein DRP45_11445 [Candidatus Zixiibacteriota bacterium]|nr:MAG: hypothetical protein DRP45_11445 [candidate division Zixibacteria bacterium]